MSYIDKNVKVRAIFDLKFLVSLRRALKFAKYIFHYLLNFFLFINFVINYQNLNHMVRK